MSLPAGAALGSTMDPTALIVGDTSQLHAAAASLEDEARRAEDVASDLRGVRVPSWSGNASSAFAADFALAPRRWEAAAESMRTCASAMTDMAGALRVAQSRAADAIARWEAGESATATARNDHEQALDRFARLATGPIMLPVPMFSDPGEAMRQEAQQILADARASLDEAGLAAARVIAAAGRTSWQDRSGSTDFLGAEAGNEDVRYTYGNDKLFGGGDPPWRKQGSRDPQSSVRVWDASAGAWVWRAEGSVQGNYHGIGYEAKGDVTALSASASSSLKIGDDSVTMGAGAEALLASAHGEVSADYGVASVQASADAKAGAFADAEFSAGKDGISAGGEVLVGGKASASGGADVGGIGVEGVAEGWAGFGAGLDLDFGLADGKLTIGGEGGAALGLGGKLGGSFTVDPGEVLDTAGDLAGGVVDFFS